jgi:hypothetical protein
MLLWPLVSLVNSRSPTGAANSFGPEIERVEVTEAQAVIKARGSDDAGLIFMFGTVTDRWTPGGLYLEAMFDVTLGRSGFERGVRWTIKSRRGLHARHRLDGPPGKMLGKIVFHPGTPSPGSDGSYIIGEFLPDEGEPLPIAVKLEKTEPTPSPAPHKSGTAQDRPHHTELHVVRVLSPRSQWQPESPRDGQRQGTRRADRSTSVHCLVAKVRLGNAVPALNLFGREGTAGLMHRLTASWQQDSEANPLLLFGVRPPSVIAK